jgi:hypothetical protein
LLSRFVDPAKQHKQLPTHRRVPFKRQLVKRQGQLFGRPPTGKLQQLRPQVEVDFAVDGDVRVPPRVDAAVASSPATTVTDRIAGKPKWRNAEIPDSSFFLFKELMPALGRHQDEESAVPKQLQVGKAGLFPANPGRFGHGDPVFPNEFVIDGHGVFRHRHGTGYVKPIAVPQVAAGDLLNKPLNASRLDSIPHEPQCNQKAGSCSLAQRPEKAANPLWQNEEWRALDNGHLPAALRIKRNVGRGKRLPSAADYILLSSLPQIHTTLLSFNL